MPFRLLVAGANETPPFPRSFWSLTHFVKEDEIAISYAADVFVLPTLAENLPNAALESVACGDAVRFLRGRRRAARARPRRRERAPVSAGYVLTTVVARGVGAGIASGPIPSRES
jgi:hypothetical protein